MTGFIYEIVNEFRFDVQSALINMEAVQKGVGRISGAVDGLFKKVMILPQMLSSSLGMSFGASGLLYGAISSFENLQKSSLDFSNIISANLESLEGPIGTFNERMQVSQNLLKDFAKTAQEFSLDENAFIQTTKMLTAQLVPKGLAGTNFGTAKEMSRGLLKSAPILGVDPNFVQGELLRAMEGAARLNDTMFRRLVAETKAFGGLKKGEVSEGVQKAGGFKGNVKVLDSISKMFNELPAASRVQLLTEALTQFGDDADVAAGNANLLSNKLMAIRQQLTGVAGVLQPIGAVIVPKLRQILDIVSKMIESHVRPAFLRLSQALQLAADNPDRVFATLYQMRELQDDLNLVAKIASFMPIIIGIKYLFQVLGAFPQAVQAFGAGIIAAFTKIGLGGLGAKIAALLNTVLLGRFAQIVGAFSLGNIFKLLGRGLLMGLSASLSLFVSALFNMKTVIKSLLFVANAFAWVLRRVLAPIILTTLAFQILSRAMGYAKILDAKNLASYSERFGQVMNRIVTVVAQILKPIDDIVDSIARLIAPLFGMTFVAGQDILGKVLWVFEGLAKALEFVRDIFINFLANLQGIFFALFRTFEIFFNMFGTLLSGFTDLIRNFFSNIKAGNFSEALSLKPLTSKLTPLSEIGVAYNAGYEDIVSRYMGDIMNPKQEGVKAIVNRNTNIDKVVINNAFKEQLEPDRIANSLVKTLMDVADNPTQARGSSLASGFFR